MALVDSRARVEALRAAGGEPAATALVELAEAEPLLGHRQTIVRKLLEEAARVLDSVGNRSLEGRVLLRLAHVKLAEADLEGVEQLAARAQERLAGDADRTLEAGALVTRALVRRKRFVEGANQLVVLGGQEPADPSLLAARRASA